MKSKFKYQCKSDEKQMFTFYDVHAKMYVVLAARISNATNSVLKISHDYDQ